MSASKKVARRPVPPHIRAFVYARDGEQCAFCETTTGLHLDHVIPHSRGGEDASWNLRPLCGPHNIERGVKWHHDDSATRLPVATTCTECNPELPGELWGWCYQCGAESEVHESQVDACPDYENCCRPWKKQLRKYYKTAKKRRV